MIPVSTSTIPPVTDEQLASIVRRKVPVSVRLDPQVLEWLKAKGRGSPDAHQ
jgi:uncharacterized protein (DUF4415 family)